MHTPAHNRRASIGRCDVIRFSETAEKRVEKNEETILLAITENRPCGSFSRAAASLFPPFLFFAAKSTYLGVPAINLLTRDRVMNNDSVNRQMQDRGYYIYVCVYLATSSVLLYRLISRRCFRHKFACVTALS